VKDLDIRDYAGLTWQAFNAITDVLVIERWI
jgi:hypothetical protein